MASSRQESSLPPEVAEKIEPNLKNDLRQEEVAKVFFEADRPYLERSHVQKRVDGDYTRDTVSRRLKELVDKGILRQDTTGSADQYWVSNEHSYWMIPDDVVVISEDNPEAITLNDLLNDKLSKNLGWGFLLSALSGISITGLAMLIGMTGVSGLFYNIYTVMVMLALVGVIAGFMLIIISISKAKLTKEDNVLEQILPF